MQIITLIGLLEKRTLSRPWSVWQDSVSTSDLRTLITETLPFSGLFDVIAHQLLFHYAGQSLAVTQVCDSSETLNRTAEEFLYWTQGCLAGAGFWLSFVKSTGGKRTGLRLDGKVSLMIVIFLLNIDTASYYKKYNKLIYIF